MRSRAGESSADIERGTQHSLETIEWRFSKGSLGHGSYANPRGDDISSKSTFQKFGWLSATLISLFYHSEVVHLGGRCSTRRR